MARGAQRWATVLVFALFFALTGSAVALDGSDTVFSDDIVDGEVKTADLDTNAVTRPKLAANAVNTNKILDGQVGVADIGNSAVGIAELVAAAVTTNKIADGAVTSSKIANGSILGLDVANNTLTGSQVDESTLFNDNSLTGADIDESTLSGITVANVWSLGGNAGTTGTDFLGTTDNQPLDLRVNDARALRLEPASDAGANPSPNVIGGSPDNQVSAGVHSATIGGGGRRDPGEPASANQVTDDQGTVGGGAGNVAGNGGGPSDVPGATVGGGVFNVAGDQGTTVSGGLFNRGIGLSATVGGGQSNRAAGVWSTVPGGAENTAQGLLSFAAGSSAKANHDGAFVWADSHDLDFPSTAQDQFSVRATGGARLVSGIDGSGTTTSGLELPANTSGWATLVNGQPFDIRVNGARGLRIDPASDGNNQSPNVIAGIADNSVTAGVHSATIAGGGRGTTANPASANKVTDDRGTVGGGANNQAGDGAGSTSDRSAATVAGGLNNTAAGNAAAVGGGLTNTAGGAQATVAGGEGNSANGSRAAIGGGLSNSAAGLRATVGGGQGNQATNTEATVGGGANSFATGLSATVPGGSGNEARGDYSLAAGRRALAQAAHSGSFVWADSNNLQFPSTAPNQFSVRATGGTRLVSGVDGSGNVTSGLELPASTSALSTLASGQPFDVRVNGARGLRIEPASDGTNQSPNVVGGIADNTVTPGVHAATIGGGGRFVVSNPASANRVTDNAGTVGGGASNQAGNGGGTVDDRSHATVGGGRSNRAGGFAATVAGGRANTADGSQATIGGGENNFASGANATVGGGGFNSAGGADSTVVGGRANVALGTSSLAAGRRAQAAHNGAFVWADGSDFDFPSTAANQFSVRATGGSRFVSSVDGSGSPIAGVELAPGGGSWSSLSDEASKRAIDPVSGRSVLRELASIPISTWSYRAQDESIRHIGPMAQDFYRAFGVGESRRRISSVDADGVALAAIKGLSARLRVERRRRHEQERRLDRLEARLAALEGR